MSADEWSRFTDALATGLGSLVAEDTVVVQFGRHYVQFAHLHTRVRAELSGNRPTLAEPLLTADQIARLSALGWRDPVPEDGDNYWYEEPAPLTESATRRLATAIVRALHEVLGFPTPADLTYEAWNDATGERLILDWLTTA